MVEVFVKWFKDNNLRLRAGGVRVELKSRIDINENEPPGAASATLETDSRIASLTAWDTGSFDIDVLSKEAQRDNFAKRYDFQDAEEMISVLETISNQLMANGEVKL